MIKLLRNVFFVLLGSSLLSISETSFSQKSQPACLAKAMKPQHKDQITDSDVKISQKLNSNQPTSETKEVELEDKDGKVKKVKAKVKRISSDEGEVEMEGLGKFKFKGKKVTAPDGTVTDFGPPRREGNKVIFPDGRVMELDEPPLPPPVKYSPSSDGRSIDSSQKIASISEPILDKESAPQEKLPASLAQNPSSVIYIAPDKPECDDDLLF
ncbi:hypothetical protein [Altericista sp. CCNU0014]|uniref:hypothetical protein n=1 Tax=Altericista sp. CCNU0014 TaxID=3082949 RepID=UPI00384ACEAB